MNCPSDLLSLQDNYSSIKSATVARRMRRDGSSAQIDILTHVRFHSTRRCLTLEHFAISPGPHAARGKVVVEASLQLVWDACLSRSIGPSIPPNLLLVCPCLAQTRLQEQEVIIMLLIFIPCTDLHHLASTCMCASMFFAITSQNGHEFEPECCI